MRFPINGGNPPSIFILKEKSPYIRLLLEKGNEVIPFNDRDYTDDFVSARKTFNADGMAVEEAVAVKKKSRIREELCAVIKKIYFQNNIPYIHLWYYPHGYKSVFSFRVDLDEYYKEDIEGLVNYGRPYSDSITWFVCCNALSGDKGIMKKLIAGGYDIQSHGYFHHVYNSVKENISNIGRSIEFLREYGLQAQGFAGPMGKWNRALCKALGVLKLHYSSEFSFDYDNLPSFPVLNKGLTKALQIPVHPICLGSFIEAGIDNKAAGYFYKVIDFKYQNNEPIILYGHPERDMHRRKDFFISIMDKAYSLDSVKKMNFSGLYKFWIKRRDFRFLVKRQKEADKFAFVTDSPKRELGYRIELPDDREAFVSSSENGVDLSRIHFNKFNRNARFYDEDIHPDTLKSGIRRIIDWEEVTPLEYIDKGSLSGIIKYAARRIKAARR